MKNTLWQLVRLSVLAMSAWALVHSAHAQVPDENSAVAQMMRTALANMSARMNNPAGSIPPAPQTIGPKKLGVIRVGVFMPNYQMGNSSGPTAGEPLRAVEQEFLAGPTIETVKISALLPMQETAEAKSLDCDYVLTSSVTQKKSNGFGALKTLSAMAPMAAMVPGVGMAGMAGLAASQSIAMASQTAGLATRGVKAKSEVTLEYSLNSISGETVLKDSQKTKAKADGEDVLTPMIQRAATSIVTSLINKGK